MANTMAMKIADCVHETAENFGDRSVWNVWMFVHKGSKCSEWVVFTNDSHSFLFHMYEEIICFDNVFMVESLFYSIMLFYLPHILRFNK